MPQHGESVPTVLRAANDNLPPFRRWMQRGAVLGIIAACLTLAVWVAFAG